VSIQTVFPSFLVGLTSEIEGRVEQPIDLRLYLVGVRVERQEYRVVLTAVAPEKVPRRDTHGMSSKVAEAIGVNRKNKPFRESVELRAHIDRLDAENMKPVAVGDTVKCVHGTCKLTVMPVRYPTVDGPCTVEISVDGVTNVSRFKLMGTRKKSQAKGEGRVRRPPILFTHAARAERKDAVSQVRGFIKGRDAASPLSLC
jgi:hypothetical protein